MAINKNFVVKNGFEVATDLILANASTKKVGIGSTNPRYNLDVRGGIGATDVIVSGVATISNELRIGTGGTIFSVIAGPTGFGQSVGVGTANPAFLLDVRSPVSTGQTALYVQGDVRITGDLAVDDISFDQATLTNLNVTGIATVARLGVSGVTTTQHLQVIGVSTFSNSVYIAGVSTFVGVSTFNSSVYVAGLSTYNQLATFNNGLQVVSGITTLGVTTATNVTNQNLLVSGITTLGVSSATNLTSQQLNISGLSTFAGVTTHTASFFGTQASFSGVVTATSFVGSGASLTGNARNLTATIGIGTSGVAVGYGVSFLDLRGPGLSTVTVDSNVGVATIYFQGGGSGSASIGIGTTPGEAFVGVVTTGNLWYNNNLGRLFIYYQDTDSEQWVDASPSNVGVITSLINVSFAPGSAVSPSMYFVGDSQTGFFSPGAGQFTVVSTGSSILNINPNGINVTGIVTSTRLSTGNVVSSGIVTAQDFDALSDQKYKENVTTVNNALLKVEQMRGVKFDWKESGLPSYGVIAQELEQVLPELVHGNDPKTVNYNGIIGVLIEAIKELKAEVEELKNTK
jgi:hypothetical protein